LAAAFGVDASAIAKNVYGNVCDSIFGTGIVEFRADSMSIGGSTKPAAYRGPGGTAHGDGTVILLPGGAGSMQIAAVLDVNNNRAAARDLGCELERLGAQSATASTPSGRTPPPSAADFAAGSARFTIAAGMGGVPVFVLTQNPETSLTNAGYRPPPGKAVIAGWIDTCHSDVNTCAAGLRAMVSGAVKKANTDGSGKVDFGQLPPGHYYVIGLASTRQAGMFWDVPVDLHAGGNTLTLDQHNGRVVAN
jgi:hypothetical protein